MNASTVALCGAVIGFGVTCGILARAAADAPPAPEPKAGRFRHERERFCAKGLLCKRLSAMIRPLTAAFWRLLPKGEKVQRYLCWQEEQLRLAGFPLGISPHEAPVVSLISAAAACVLAALVSSSFSGVFVSGVLGLALPVLRIQALRGERVRAAAREVPRTMDLLSLCMGAGMDLVGGLKEVSSNDRGIVAVELRHLLATLEMGQTRGGALREFYDNLPAIEVGDFTRAVIQAEAKGASVRDALMHQATMSRQRRSVRAEELASRAGVLLTLPMMMLVVCVLVLVLGPMIANPSQF